MTFEKWWTETMTNSPVLTNEIENNNLLKAFEYIAHAAWIASREEIFKEAEEIRRANHAER